MLGKADAAHVGQVQPVHINHSELGVWIVHGDLAKRVSESEACHDDWVCTRFSKAAQRLFALRVGLQFDFKELGAAIFFGPTRCATKGGFVERFVELAAKVKNNGWLC